jgi:hypothetical protein
VEVPKPTVEEEVLQVGEVGRQVVGVEVMVVVEVVVAVVVVVHLVLPDGVASPWTLPTGESYGTSCVATLRLLLTPPVRVVRLCGGCSA